MELIDYDCVTGVFRWRYRVNMRCRKDLLAGSWCKKRGYLYIGIDGIIHLAHRLAWIYIHGVLPAEGIDHIDGNTGNNKISNLREAGQDINSWNARTPKNNKSGHKGVFWNKHSGKWLAYVSKHNKCVFRKEFPTLGEAVIAVRLAREKHHGEFTNHG